MIKVMIAEDNIHISKNCFKFLTNDENIKVVSCTLDGEETLKDYFKLQPDVLLLDLNMPKINGIDVINTIGRFAGERSKCNIVVVSGSSDYLYRLYNTAQVYRVIHKPVDFDYILKTIKEQNKTTIVNIMRVLFRHANIETKRKIFKSIIDGLGGKLRKIVAGGAPMDKETIKGYNDFGFDVHQGYGLTETSPVLAGENSFNKKTGSVGFPLPTIEIKIDNPDSNGIGEIIAKTPAIMLGYYKNEEATKEVLKNGYFHTGDLGYIDDDGFIFITGRKKI